MAGRAQGLVLAGAGVVWMGRDSVRNFILTDGVLRNNAPTEELMTEVVDGAKDQQAVIESFWATKKIAHREGAIRQITRLIPSGAAMRAVRIVDSGGGIGSGHGRAGGGAGNFARARDRAGGHLPGGAAGHRPEARQIGLESLKPVGAEVGVPLVMPLLEDSDPRIAVLRV